VQHCVETYCIHLLLWRWRQRIPSKYFCQCTKQLGGTSTLLLLLHCHLMLKCLIAGYSLKTGFFFCQVSLTCLAGSKAGSAFSAANLSAALKLIEAWKKKLDPSSPESSEIIGWVKVKNCVRSCDVTRNSEL